MIIAIYGIIIFMLTSWIRRKEEHENIRVANMSGFSHEAILSRHDISSKPMGCR